MISKSSQHLQLGRLKKDFEKYRGKYQAGWDQLRKDRIARQKKLGIIDASTELPPRPKNVPAWDSLSDKEKDTQELMMAAYAGMIDCVDQNLGRLVEQLKALKELDNTLILFLSDNGACPFQRTKPPTLEKQLMPYDPKSYWTYDRGWAHACNTPLREYKQNQHEGGIATPMIAHWPAVIKSNANSPQGMITGQPAHLVDIMATLLDVSQTKYPSEYQGRQLGPLRGYSLRPVFEGKVRDPHDYLFFSFRGKNNAIRIGNWKLVNKNNEAFELYNIATDRNELVNMADKQPERFKKMKSKLREISLELGATIKQKKNRN